MTPVSRLTTGMSNCNHMNVFAPLSMHRKVRKVPKQNTPGTRGSLHARSHVATSWLPQDQLKHASRFGKELRAQSLPSNSRQSAKSLELRTAMSRNRLWQEHGKNAEAYWMLAESYG